MLLKDLYSVSFYNNFAEVLEEVIPSFDRKGFEKTIFDETWEGKELKERMKHTSMVLSKILPTEFEAATKLIERIICRLQQKGVKENGLEYMFFPDYIETYGIDHFDAAVRSIEFVTQFTSCEFAVRPFIIKYGNRMIEQMLSWSLHEDHMVRRLASEGSRPRLPWAIALPGLKKNPAPILPILENLKSDPSDWVRRSVANALNDISKDNPDIVISIAKQWHGIGKETDAIIKHGCRTLLKNGHADILSYYGLSSTLSLHISDFRIITPKIKVGDCLEFSFTLKNISTEGHNVRLEYGLHFLRKNGQLSKKVFKISERKLLPSESIPILKKHSFKVITTRKFYAGIHQVSIIINGVERGMGKFMLL